MMGGMQGRNLEQRQIARAIWRLKGRQRRNRKSWMDCDVKINNLQQKLDKQVRHMESDRTLEPKKKKVII